MATEQELKAEIERLRAENRAATKNPVPGAGSGRWMFTFAAAAYNLVRMRNLLAQAA